MDKILVFPCSIETLCSEDKIFNFLKRHFSGIIFTFVDDFTLNSDNNKEI